MFLVIQLQTIITTVQQHENLLLIVASQVDQLWQHFVTHSSPVCPHQQTTVAKYPFHRSRWQADRSLFLAMDSALWTLYLCSLTYDFLFCLNFTLHEWRRPSLHGPKSQDQDRDRDSRVPIPRPRLWGSETKAKTKTLRFQDQDQDQDRDSEIQDQDRDQDL